MYLEVKLLDHIVQTNLLNMQTTILSQASVGALKGLHDGVPDTLRLFISSHCPLAHPTTTTFTSSGFSNIQAHRTP